MQRSPMAINWIALLASVAIGASAFVVTKFGLDGIGPLWLVAGRLSIAGVVMALLLRGRFRFPTMSEWPTIFLIGAIGWTIPLGIISWASFYISASVIGIMMAAGPIIVALISLVMLREEKLTPWRAVGLLVGFGGVALIILGRTVSASDGVLANTEMGHSWWPYLLTLLSVVMFSMGTLMVRKSSHIPALTKGVGCLIAGGICGIIIALVLEPFPVGASTTGITALLYLAIVNSGINGVLIYWLVDRTSARFVTQSNYILPIATMMLGALVLSETLTVLQYVGIVVVILGLVLSERRSRVVAPPQPAPAE